MLITSSSNEQIKAARRVRDGKERGLLFLEGERLVRDALSSAITPLTCFHSPELSSSAAALLPELVSKGARLLSATPQVMKALGDTIAPQGIIVLAEKPPADSHSFWRKLPPAPLLVALDRVQDPGNLGTILRTAEAAGVDGLVTLAGSADGFAPKVLRASMGSALRLPMLPGWSESDLLEAAHQRGLRLVAACGGAAQSHRDLDWRGPLLLILGNEGAGISPSLLAACEERVSIPIQAPVESLNVASAAAVLLFEAAHQRRSC
jgi:RNA methyltransferase, TrmH family